VSNGSVTRESSRLVGSGVSTWADGYRPSVGVWSTEKPSDDGEGRRFGIVHPAGEPCVTTIARNGSRHISLVFMISIVFVISRQNSLYPTRMVALGAGSSRDLAGRLVESRSIIRKWRWIGPRERTRRRFEVADASKAQRKQNKFFSRSWSSSCNPC